MGCIDVRKGIFNTLLTKRAAMYRRRSFNQNLPTRSLAFEGE